MEDYYLGMAMADEDPKPEVVYVIMYNAGTEQEGVHTINSPRGADTDLLLAFESLEDCIQLANAIKQGASAQGSTFVVPGDPIPTPSPWMQMEGACQQMGLPVKVVKATSIAE
jgi:Protein of unknown function (DUF3110)